MSKSFHSLLITHHLTKDSVPERRAAGNLFEGVGEFAVGLGFERDVGHRDDAAQTTFAVNDGEAAHLLVAHLAYGLDDAVVRPGGGPCRIRLGSSRRAPVPCRRSRREGPGDAPRADARARRTRSRAAARSAAPRRACAARPRKSLRPSRRAVSTYRPPENAPSRLSPRGPPSPEGVTRPRTLVRARSPSTYFYADGT